MAARILIEGKAVVSNMDDSSAHTFDAFVAGLSNRIAYHTAQAVARGSTAGLVPFYLSGPSGLGKTHLLQAIGAAYQHHNPLALVVYTTGDALSREVAVAVRNAGLEAWRDRLRQADVLLLDDVDRASEALVIDEMAGVAEDLKAAGKIVAVAALAPPCTAGVLTIRFRRALEGGLTAAIVAPDLATAARIVRLKAAANGFDLPEAVALYIARSHSDDVRQLEGALHRVLAYAAVLGGRLDLALVQRALEGQGG